ncbi:RecQ family ATP-dependent DNA helicase [Flavihumibacter rivuli]|uniref:RecQ family ATP-dependent DNA helicase n=1 Tax=Flavihumibacter rivuli TaxID=2838156 RepID=UPI001BDE33A9|nr:RecQ family ATP-dependent DNA helicase [Flavihumibacter rivuli]ULQ55830.1 RecQ family ATP-dependent DNA helicase [Flavihumibacter rivuli]
MNHVVTFFDLEVDPKSKKIADLGYISSDHSQYHGTSIEKLLAQFNRSQFIAGHNILLHDLPYMARLYPDIEFDQWKHIDTLFLSPILFPSKPYHRLLKDDKISDDAPNNPLNDSIKARDLFFDELATFQRLNPNVQQIFYHLLTPDHRFKHFFEYIAFRPTSNSNLLNLIRDSYQGKFCFNSPLESIIETEPVELAYALALIGAQDRQSILPRWLLFTFPRLEYVLKLLRGTPCPESCQYCSESLDARRALKKYFGYDAYRVYDGEPLQEKAVTAAINNKSLLAIFPTGGGKSITFQVPALISADTEKGLTVVISPLQSLMKDQVDNLLEKQITAAVTINGLLDPIERSMVLEQVADGSAGILYISPESLRSATIEKVLLGRHISRFVIDEAHCFSSWGHDFRVDYLYIAEFIKTIQQKKNLEFPIPVSCFSATAKPQVVDDIRNYFKSRLNLELELFQASVRRKNLHYKVIRLDSDESKYDTLRNLLAQKDCPTIIYVSRTKKAEKIAEKLSADGYEALAFHGKMDRQDKTSNQNDFIAGSTRIIVATAAFGMGVDKKDVGMVIHYDISDSLENYVQEAGRAGRDEALQADCYVLFNPDDLDRHFSRLNQTKMSQAEINQIWKAIKDLTRKRVNISNSVLEIARKGGWEEGIEDLETRVKTAIAALENASYLRRKQNMPRVFATSIEVFNADEAISRVNNSARILPDQKVNAIRIIKSLISSNRKSIGRDEAVESRVDYIADRLGITVYETIELINLLREEKILADAKDIQISIDKGEDLKAQRLLLEHVAMERALSQKLSLEATIFNIKELLDDINNDLGKEYSPTFIKNILNFWVVKKWCKRQLQEYSRNHLQLQLTLDNEKLLERIEKRAAICNFIIEFVGQLINKSSSTNTKEGIVNVSVIGLRDSFIQSNSLFKQSATIEEIEDALFYLSRIGAMNIEGGFIVTYNKIQIERIEKNNKVQYKKEDYAQLEEYYKQKAEQIHIVGEYAKRMANNYEDAINFTEDYFSLPYDRFIRKYFPGEKARDLKMRISPEKFKRIFGSLDPRQLSIINDKDHQHIIVAAGPGSGKTRILVSKMASLLLMEDIKHEQLLMLTFSRAAAMEFKKRLLELIGPVAHYVEIKTFHAYCFDLLGRQGNLEKSNDILKITVNKIRNGEIEPNRITKQVLVVDEAQDINDDEFELIKALLEQNENMRTLLVGDDDQNIFDFRGASNRALNEMARLDGSVLYHLVTNYRSVQNIVAFSNQWARYLQNRMKREEISAKTIENGLVELVQYAGKQFNIGVAEEITRQRPEGTIAVLTYRNEEVLQMQCLLQRAGIPNRIMQHTEGFYLYNLLELKEFTDWVCLKTDSPVITKEDWESAKKGLKAQYGKSTQLPSCLGIIDAFEQSSPGIMYKSDWKTLLAESGMDDFTGIGSELVYLSTIHKAKGREFDNVYLMLNGLDPKLEETKRLIYVALTRAKKRLFIHYNGTYFDRVKVNGQTNRFDATNYDLPPEIKLQLTHKDVQLGYFEYVQNRVRSLLPGSELNILNDAELGYKENRVVKYSSSFREKLEVFYQNGYRQKRAEVNYVVYWKNPNNGSVCRILLPVVYLNKYNDNH